jgi:hypothetical protein
MKTLLQGAPQLGRVWPLAVVAALLCRPVSAQTLAVSDYSTFKAALRSYTNVTNFATNVTISLTSVGQTLDITRSVTIDGGTNYVVFDGGQVTRLFTVQPDCQLTLKNVQVINCVSPYSGGAIYNQGALIISNCIIAGNSVTNASGSNGVSGVNGANGGDGVSGGPALGGAIYSTGPVSIYYSVLGTNTAGAGSGGSGGAGTSGFIFGGVGGNGGSGGGAYGAALYSTGVSNVFIGTAFFNNVCTAGAGGSGGSAGSGPFPGAGGTGAAGGSSAGGAVYVTGGLSASNCLFAHNTVTAGASGADASGNHNGPDGGSAQGGGLYISSAAGSAYLRNCVFFENTCAGGAGGSGSTGVGAGGSALGGGLDSAAAATWMRFCTLATNTLTTATNGTILGFDVCGTGGVIWLSDSILSGGTNGTPEYVPNAYGVTDAGYNISSDASLTRLSSHTLIDTDPVLDSGLAVYEGFSLGPTNVSGPKMMTLAILAGSPAAGIVPGLPGVSFPATDESGVARSSPTSAGAYEIAPLVIETNGQAPILNLRSNQYNVAAGGTVVLEVNVTSSSEATNFGLAISARSNVIDLTISNTLPGMSYLLMEKTNLTAPSWTVIQTLTATGSSTAAAPVSTGTNQSLFFAATLTTNDQTALNQPLSYQWLFNGVILSDNATYSGTTSSNLTVRGVTAAQQGTNYQVIVGVSTLQGVTRESISLSIIARPKITLEPVSRTNAPYGSAVTFKVVASGSVPLSYQWHLGTNKLTDNSEISGSATANLTINPAATNDDGRYSVVVTNQYGSIASAVAVLIVVPDKTKPTVAISSPLANARATNPVITGTAFDNAQVIAINYSVSNVNTGTVINGTNNLGANGATNKTWAITNAVLPGTNYVTVQSFNYSGKPSSPVTREFFYVAPARFALTTNGFGSVTGSASVAGNVVPANGALLNIGEGYTLTAKPGRNYVLTNWIGSNALMGAFTNNGLTLHFIMESNETITANFTTNLFIGARGTYNGLFYGSNSFTVQTAGMLYNLTVATSGVYSGKLLFNGGSFTLAPGSFDSSGYASNRVPRAPAQGGPVALEMWLGWTNGEINGSVSGTDQGGWSNFLYAEKAAASSPSCACTALLAPGANAEGEIPPGFGYMLITNHNGSVTLNGAVADGAAFGQTVPLGMSGGVPVFSTNLYSHPGLLLGWLALSNGTVLAETPMAWIKPARSGIYTNGFTNLLSLTGSGWTNPPPGVPAISLTGGALIVTNSSLALAFVVSITNNTLVKETNSVSTNSLTGAITNKTGLLKIIFGNGTGRATTVGYGAILQDSNSGGGYFVTKTNAGYFRLLPP